MLNLFVTGVDFLIKTYTFLGKGGEEVVDVVCERVDHLHFIWCEVAGDSDLYRGSGGVGGERRVLGLTRTTRRLVLT